jgi:hypothetical protein
MRGEVWTGTLHHGSEWEVPWHAGEWCMCAWWGVYSRQPIHGVQLLVEFCFKKLKWDRSVVHVYSSSYSKGKD